MHLTLLLGLALLASTPESRLPTSLPGTVSMHIVGIEDRPNGLTNNKRPSRQNNNVAMVRTGDIKSSSHDQVEKSGIKQEKVSSFANGKKETPLSELQRLLLIEINQHKHYPVNALRLKQQGTTRVEFRLRKNGRIDTLAVLHSSGYRSLDRAALSAINDIQPFTPANDLIHKPANLQIDIAFQM